MWVEQCWYRCLLGNNSFELVLRVKTVPRLHWWVINDHLGFGQMGLVQGLQRYPYCILAMVLVLEARIRSWFINVRSIDVTIIVISLWDSSLNQWFFLWWGGQGGKPLLSEVSQNKLTLKNCDWGWTMCSTNLWYSDVTRYSGSKKCPNVLLFLKEWLGINQVNYLIIWK